MEKAKNESLSRALKSAQQENEILHTEYQNLYGCTDSRNLVKFSMENQSLKDQITELTTKVETLQKSLLSEKEKCAAEFKAQTEKLKT